MSKGDLEQPDNLVGKVGIVPPVVLIKKKGFAGLPTWLWITIIIAAWAGLVVGVALIAR